MSKTPDAFKQLKKSLYRGYAEIKRARQRIANGDDPKKVVESLTEWMHAHIVTAEMDALVAQSFTQQMIHSMDVVTSHRDYLIALNLEDQSLLDQLSPEDRDSVVWLIDYLVVRPDQARKKFAGLIAKDLQVLKAFLDGRED